MIERFSIDILRRGDGWVSVVTVYRSGCCTDDTLPMSQVWGDPTQALRDAVKLVRRAKLAADKSGGAR